MDKKAIVMLKHYKQIIEACIFDEYDVLGFLIFIREYIEDQKYLYIRDFADLIAHRNRNRGTVMECISGAIRNNYKTVSGSKKLIDYNGMDYNDWKNEWLSLGDAFDITFSETCILEITLCVFSLSQYTEYQNKGNDFGKIELLHSDNLLGLTTTEGKMESFYVCFSLAGPFLFEKRYIAGHINQPVETIRINGVLRLKDSEGFII